MKPGPLRYLAPATVEEAVATLRQHPDAKVLAGGQSLIPVLSMRLARPSHLVDLGAIPGLDRVEVSESWVRVGAMVTHARLLADEDAYAVLPLLRQALENVAHPAIRNRGTTVGSIAHADAAGEMPSILVMTDGVVEAIGPDGAREIPAAEFFLGPLETALASDEIVVAVRFGRFPERTFTAFRESARRQGDYALAGAAVAVTVDADHRIVAARAAFVSVTDVPSALDLSGPLGGQLLAKVDWSCIDDAVQAHLAPESDIHAGADYRRMLAGELTRRACAAAAADAMAAGAPAAGGNR
ncbi:MAG TPA: xanthine dehydrogenase family protein subunit M [Intrasporangiaceae bacterium]|nr:xanthine dehydrogenase family protein subunit M [Intrasporangiaceae bacterium]